MPDPDRYQPHFDQQESLLDQVRTAQAEASRTTATWHQTQRVLGSELVPSLQRAAQQADKARTSVSTYELTRAVRQLEKFVRALNRYPPVLRLRFRILMWRIWSKRWVFLRSLLWLAAFVLFVVLVYLTQVATMVS